MKKILSSTLAFVTCFTMLLFAAACGDNKVENGNGEETIPKEEETIPKEMEIDFDTGEFTPSKYFSIEITHSTQPLKKSSLSITGTKFVKYDSTGTLTVKIEPLAGYRMRAEGVYMEMALHTDFPSSSDQIWKFAQGGRADYNYQIKNIIVTLSGNGTATVTENIKLSFTLDSISAIFFNENSISLSPYWECTSKYIHGKIYLLND